MGSRNPWLPCQSPVACDSLCTGANSPTFQLLADSLAEAVNYDKRFQCHSRLELFMDFFISPIATNRGSTPAGKFPLIAKASPSRNQCEPNRS